MSIWSKSVGWALMGKYDMADALALTFSRDGAAKQLGVYNWQFDMRSQLSKVHVEKELIKARMHANYGSKIYTDLHKMLESTVPKGLREQFAKALAHGNTDDLVAPIVDTMVTFSLSGFQLVVQDDDEREKVKEFNKKTKIYQAITLALNVLASTDNVAILYRKNSKAIEVLDLGLLTIVPTYQYDKNGNPLYRTFYTLDDEFKTYIRKLIRSGGGNRDQKKQTVEGVPDKYIAAALGHNRPDPIKPPGSVELLKEDDEYVYIANLKGLRGRLISPSMIGVFPSIELRKLLQNGELSVSYLIEHFIHQIKIGPSAENMTLGQALRSRTVSSKDKTDALKDYAEIIDQVMVEVTDQFVEHVFHFPGHEVDFTKKFESPDERIRTWARTSKQIITGQAGNYSGGTIYLKSYRAKIDHMREVIEEVFGEIYRDHVAVKGEIKYEWSRNYLKEPKQIMEEVRFLTQYGMPAKMGAGLLNYNYMLWEQIKSEMLPPEIMKAKDNKEERYKYLQALDTPIFEPNQGILSEKAGRPSENDNQSDNDNVVTTPRPADGNVE